MRAAQHLARTGIAGSGQRLMAGEPNEPRAIGAVQRVAAFEVGQHAVERAQCGRHVAPGQGGLRDAGGGVVLVHAVVGSRQRMRTLERHRCHCVLAARQLGAAAAPQGARLALGVLHGQRDVECGLRKRACFVGLAVPDDELRQVQQLGALHRQVADRMRQAHAFLQVVARLREVAHLQPRFAQVAHRDGLDQRVAQFAVDHQLLGVDGQREHRVALHAGGDRQHVEKQAFQLAQAEPTRFVKAGTRHLFASVEVAQVAQRNRQPLLRAQPQLAVADLQGELQRVLRRHLHAAVVGHAQRNIATPPRGLEAQAVVVQRLGQRGQRADVERLLGTPAQQAERALAHGDQPPVQARADQRCIVWRNRTVAGGRVGRHAVERL